MTDPNQKDLDRAAKQRSEINPAAEETYWRGAYIKEPYYDKNYSYEDYAPAYRTSCLHRKNSSGRTWEQAEPELKADWELDKEARLRWYQVRGASRAAWDRIGRNA